MGIHTLLIDDDKEFSDLLIENIQGEGFDVVPAYDGEQGIKEALNKIYDVIILDVMLPKKNGFEVLQILREKISTPILMLTARGDDIDRIVGLEIGADDYLPKPCNPRELIARLKAILRRVKPHDNQATEKPLYQIENLTLNCTQRIAYLSDKPLELTNTEFNILEVFIKSPAQAFSKEELTQFALGKKYTAYDRSIDVHISNLRNKLGKNLQNEEWIKTVRGFGYSFHA